MTDHLETEQKYEADAEFVLPQLDGLPGVVQVSDPELYRLDATYYDTPDFALIRGKVTLRRRTGGTDEGWHLKLPVRADTRQEVHEPLGSAAEAAHVPLRLSSRVAHLTAGRPLHPIALLSTERTVRRLSGNAGSPLAEVADDRVTAQRLAPPPTPSAPDAPPTPSIPSTPPTPSAPLTPDASPTPSASSAPLVWREIEVELTGPETPGLLAAAAQLLKDAGARPARSASKLGRLLAESADPAAG